MAAEPKKWTVLVWSACDNDLYACCVNDIDKCERGLPADVNVVAQVDHRLNPNPAGPHTVQRLELQKNSEPLLNSPVVQDFGDADMASPKNLSDFIQWGIKNYPAQNYWLVISDHGDSWKGASQDEGHHTWMSLPQVESALQDARAQTGRKLDLLSFDCCHMASIEVAHQLQDEARYMVASEEVMGYLGLPYEKLLGEVGELDPAQVARRLVESSTANPEDIPTFSALDLQKMPALSEAMTGLSHAIACSPLSGSELRQSVQETQAFWEYRDVHHLAENLAAQPDPALREAAQRVQSAVRGVVLAEQHAATHPGATGLSVEVNPDSEAARQARYAEGTLNREDQRPWRTEEGSYAETAFAQDTGWLRAIEKFTKS